MRTRNFGHFSFTGFQLERWYNERGKRTFQEIFLDFASKVNKAPYDNGTACVAINMNAMDVNLPIAPDVVYMDPPYYSQKSCCNYSNYYHFVEGIARDWQGIEIDHGTKTKRFKSYPNVFKNKQSARQSFETLFQRYQDSVLVVSYSSNCQPTLEEMVEMLKKYKRNVEVKSQSITYSMSNTIKGNPNNRAQEYIFVAY
jgi:DNA adenine methylase